jgi:hypothetical protein
MSLQPIPAEWCAAVCTVLRSGDPAKIRFTKEGRQRWEREFLGAYRYQLEAAFVTALRGAQVHGCSVCLPYPPGTTWEFFFIFHNEKLYGKILLTPDRASVLILSAHRPERPHLQCDRP